MFTMYRKMKPVVSLAFCCLLVAMAFGCAGPAQGAGEELEPAESFLLLYYTVEAYTPAPKSAEDVQRLEEQWQPYFTSDGLESFMLNRDATRVSSAAEEAGVTVLAKSVTLKPVEEEYGYSKYSVEADIASASGTNAVAFTGKIMVDENGLVSVFSPDELPALGA